MARLQRERQPLPGRNVSPSLAVEAQRFDDESRRSDAMKSILFGAALTLAGISLATTGAEAKGCIKGALVGGVAGHMAGHGVMGAAAGCAVGRHQANKRDREQNQAQPQQPAR
jgi:outer membrane lipoprotein SlyB